MRVALAALLLFGCGGGSDSINDAGGGSSSTDASLVDAPPGSIWTPAPGTTWQWQLTDTIDTSVDAAMYDIDLVEAPQPTIDALHALGRNVICYFSAGSYEPYRSDADMLPVSARGNELDGWPGELWLDTRDATVRNVMRSRLDLAVTKHCDGVEPDNVDGYANDSGFPLTAATQLDYNKFLAAEAHARGLSVGLKNDLDQIGDLLADFDWALNEECYQYSECALLSPFITAGKAVFHVEYGDPSLAATVCPTTTALGLSTLVKNLDLDAQRTTCP